MNKANTKKYKDEFRTELKRFATKLKNHISTDNGDWTIKGFIDIYKNIYTISSDTKLGVIYTRVDFNDEKDGKIYRVDELNEGKWIEPFLGTGVVAFNSGFKQAILNDTNPHIINFYKGIQNGTITPGLVRKYLEGADEKLSSADENGYAYFREVRDRFNKEFAPLDLLFLSRAGFNGMMRFSSKGNWNIPFCKKQNRFAQSYITKIVNQVAKVRAIINENWTFTNKSFADIIPLATADDIIYCDPPYYGRYVDYYNGWTEQDEGLLFNLLSETKARFILSTWHHNDWRANEMIEKFWNKFHIVTKDHFYHSGGNIENRRTIVEALVCSFELNGINGHNHGLREKSKTEQLALRWTE